MRPDANRYLRPNWRRDVRPGSDLWQLYERVERKYSPNQLRVPAGSREGGQWISGGGGGGEAQGRLAGDVSSSSSKSGVRGQMIVADNGVLLGYGRSQYAEIASAIQTVSGIDIVFLPAPGDYAKTDGKVLDYADGRGLFLRMP